MARKSWRRWLGYPSGTVLSLAALKVAIHLALATRYGWFRDELYYVAGSEHIALGYVDYPPLTALLLAGVRAVLGDSLFAIRLLPALAGGALLLMVAAMVRRLEGGKFAQALAALAVLVAPIYLAGHGIWTPNVFDQLLWAIGSMILLDICAMRRRGGWIRLGLVCGIGLQVKHSMAFFCVALGIALLLTRQRRWLVSGWLWAGVGIAALFALPNLWWEWQHGWATWELLREGAENKNLRPGVVQFLVGQAMIFHPLAAPIWLAGVCHLCFARIAKPYRLLGCFFVAMFVGMMALQAKHYYVAPVYPVVIAAGALAVERFVARRGRPWMRPAIVSVLALGGLAFAPLTLPILPPELAAPYQQAIERGSTKMEKGVDSELLQVHADMFGWPELADTVAQVYLDLPEQDRRRCVVYCVNYGRAGAIDLFGRPQGLPSASCPHNSYWWWGPPERDGDVTIVVGGSNLDLGKLFATVTTVAHHEHRWAAKNEQAIPIFLCRGIKRPFREFWSELRYYR